VEAPVLTSAHRGGRRQNVSDFILQDPAPDGPFTGRRIAALRARLRNSRTVRPSRLPRPMYPQATWQQIDRRHCRRVAGGREVGRELRARLDGRMDAPRARARRRRLHPLVYGLLDPAMAVDQSCLVQDGGRGQRWRWRWRWQRCKCTTPGRVSAGGIQPSGSSNRRPRNRPRRGHRTGDQPVRQAPRRSSCRVSRGATAYR
jgi:hypothetical protein